MSSEYPDVLGDLVEARRRFEVSGVHYVMALDSPSIAPGEVTNLRIWLQSCWAVPAEVAIFVNLPTKPAPTFSIIQQRTDVPLEAAEVGEVAIPIACGADTLSADYTLSTKIGVKPERHGLFVRGEKSEGHLGETLLSFTTGMALAATVGLEYAAQGRPEMALSLEVSGPAQPNPAPDLTPTYLSHWTVDELPIYGKARQQVNDQRLYLTPQLTREALYVAFLEESQERFKDASLPLQIGEAIFLAKILTYTVEYLMKQPLGQDAILIPAYALAYRYNLMTKDPVMLVVRADYARMARLATSLSFGMLRQRLNRDVWSMEEQLAVADLIADRVERGGALPPEFLYLPLLLGGLMVAGQVQMPREDPTQSLELFAKAREQRSAALADLPELVELLDRLEQAARSTS
ncbi:MAG: hypothetical protein PVF77_03340 [Anaerolineae bacterium]|jgi:hypothetical protein